MDPVFALRETVCCAMLVNLSLADYSRDSIKEITQTEIKRPRQAAETGGECQFAAPTPK